MAGHSKWANIKHRKGRQDAKRSKVWSKCSRAIIVAAKAGGGDPAANLTLRYAIDEAKAANMPKDTIENAIRKGTGTGDDANYEEAVYEGYGPHGVAILIDILTDNRNRTAGEIRKVFERGGGSLGSSGCVAYLFTGKGQILISKSAVSEDQLMTVALEAGAEDIVDDGEAWEVLCDPSDFMSLREALEKAGIKADSAGVTKLPSTYVNLTGDAAQKLLNLVDNLEDHDDVQKVYANFDVPDEALAALDQ